MKMQAIRCLPFDKPDIVRVLASENVELTQRGRYFWACCPFHTEKTPSFKVDPHRQTFYCFGCQRHGDVVAFVRGRHGLSFREAKSYLGMEKEFKYKPNPVQIADSNERKELIRSFRLWEHGRRDEIAFILRTYRQTVAQWDKPLTAADLEALASYQGEIDRLEYVYEILCSKSDTDKYELYKHERGN